MAGTPVNGLATPAPADETTIIIPKQNIPITSVQCRVVTEAFASKAS
jgi:hypothetical protein